jgi:hypothetical protein
MAELIEAYTERTCVDGQIDRLMAELAAVRQLVQRAPASDEQSRDAVSSGSAG